MTIDEIYRELAPKLQSYLTGNGCTYATACDIVQETFLRLWKRREELTDDIHQVSGLVFTIARNYRNDLARKAKFEVFGNGEDPEKEEPPSESVRDTERPGEEEEETTAVCLQLKKTLARMPGQLLETFALSRLGSLSVKDIAVGTGVSESNVKVRVHRAREMFLSCYKAHTAAEEGEVRSHVFAFALLRAVMMLAAVDGEIAKEELALYRELAEEFKGEDASTFDAEWEKSVRAMAYIGFLSEIVDSEALVSAYVRETKATFAEVGDVDLTRVIATLERMATADGEYSTIERTCIATLNNRIDSL